jgi:4-amino-4-deoxychorismate lyase
MKISINGKICDEKEGYISIYDHGFLYGMGLFETFRTYQGKPFLWEEHVTRLRLACLEAGIVCQINEHETQELITQLLAENQLKDAYFRYSISAGVETLGMPQHKYENPTHIMYVKELPTGAYTDATKSKNLQLLQHKRNTPDSRYRLKSFHYMNNILAKFELQRYPWAQEAEGLMLTQTGHLAEGIVSNLFFVRDHQLCTPSLDTGILAGVTRNCVIQIAQRLQMKVIEGWFTWEDLVFADEVFLTNSIQGIMSVTHVYDIEGNQYPIGAQSSSEDTSLYARTYQLLTESVT